MALLILKFPVLLFLYMHDCYRFSCQERLTTSLHRITFRHSDRHHKPIILPYILDICGFWDHQLHLLTIILFFDLRHFHYTV